MRFAKQTSLYVKVLQNNKDMHKLGAPSETIAKAVKLNVDEIERIVEKIINKKRHSFYLTF